MFQTFLTYPTRATIERIRVCILIRVCLIRKRTTRTKVCRRPPTSSTDPRSAFFMHLVPTCEAMVIHEMPWRPWERFIATETLPCEVTNGKRRVNTLLTLLPGPLLRLWHPVPGGTRPPTHPPTHPQFEHLMLYNIFQWRQTLRNRECFMQ